MLSVDFNPFPLLETARLVLRQVQQKDVKEIFFLRSDDRVLKYLGRRPAKTIQEATKWIRQINDFEKNNEAITWAITLTQELKLAGTICFWNIRKEHYRAEIGYALHPAYQNRGIMQEAMKAVLDFGFKTMKLHSVEANVHPENASSIQLLERNNFVREGYFRENYFYNGKFYDSAIYSLVAPNEDFV